MHPFLPSHRVFRPKKESGPPSQVVENTRSESGFILEVLNSLELGYLASPFEIDIEEIS